MNCYAFFFAFFAGALAAFFVLQQGMVDPPFESNCAGIVTLAH